MKTTYHFLNNLLTAMECFDLSVYKLAKDTNRAISTFSRYLQKNDPSKLPRKALIMDVARYFGVTASDMVNRKIDPEEFSLNPLPDDYEEQIAMIASVPLYTAADLISIQAGESVEAKTFLSAPPIRRSLVDAELFAYDVLGNAFQPQIRHGDITFCYRYSPELALRDGAVVLACVIHAETKKRTVLFGHLTYGSGGEKLIIYNEQRVHRVPIAEDEILGVVAVNCTEYV